MHLSDSLITVQVGTRWLTVDSNNFGFHVCFDELFWWLHSIWTRTTLDKVDCVYDFNVGEDLVRESIRSVAVIIVHILINCQFDLLMVSTVYRVIKNLKEQPNWFMVMFSFHEAQISKCSRPIGHSKLEVLSFTQQTLFSAFPLEKYHGVINCAPRPVLLV